MGGLVDTIFGGGAEAPNYQPVAEASKYSADVSKELGNRQMDMAQQQYDRTMAALKPVLDSELAVNKQTAQQGKDYYDYMVSRQRPVEDTLYARAMGITPAQMQEISDMRATETSRSHQDFENLRGYYGGEYQRQIAEAKAADAAYYAANPIIAPPAAPQGVSATGVSGLTRNYPDMATWLHDDIGNRSAGANGVDNRATTQDIATLAEFIKQSAAPQGGVTTPRAPAYQSKVADLQGKYDELMGRKFDDWATVDTSGSDALMRKYAAAGQTARDTADAAERGKITDYIAGIGETDKAIAYMVRDRGDAAEKAALEDAAAMNARAAAMQAYGAAESRRLAGLSAALRSKADEFYGQQQGDINEFKLGDTDFYTKHQGDIENDVGRAIADARAGQAQALNAAARQALRYGISPVTGLAAPMLSQAQQIAAAANGARDAQIDKYRGLVGQGIGFRQNAYDSSSRSQQAALQGDTSASQMGLDSYRAALAAHTDAANMAATARQQGIANFGSAIDLYRAGENTGLSSLTTGRDLRLADYARTNAQLLDVAGLYRGLPGASTAAYNTSLNAGNNVSSQLSQTGRDLMTGTNLGANTVMTGAGQNLQGQLGILSGQSSYNNALTTQRGQNMDFIGTVTGTALGKKG